MRILSITAQKPDSTGSGIYLTELVRAMQEMGHQQAVIAGIYREDRPVFPEGTAFFPVYFETEELPFPIAGMSDEMPYRSTRYRDMTEDMADRFMHAFEQKALEAVEAFRPDLIICHHLYLMTAALRRALPEERIYGICHNTDLRQMVKTDLRRDFIAENIAGLDRIFTAQQEQVELIRELYGVEEERIRVIGTGYSQERFYDRGLRKRDGIIRLVFAGKIAEKKGVMSLLRALSAIGPELAERMQLTLAGGAGNREEYQEIRKLAERCPVKTVFTGRLDQDALAELYCKSDIFVLPSYYDSIPLTLVEALACGCRAVVSELPGLKPWILGNVPGADVSFVRLPEMEHADEPKKESLPAFEKRLSEALRESAEKGCTEQADLSRVSWRGLAERILNA